MYRASPQQAGQLIHLILLGWEGWDTNHEPSPGPLTTGHCNKFLGGFIPAVPCHLVRKISEADYHGRKGLNRMQDDSLRFNSFCYLDREIESVSRVFAKIRREKNRIDLWNHIFPSL